MKIFNSILLASSLCVALFSCTKEEPTPEAKADDLVGKYIKQKTTTSSSSENGNRYLYISDANTIEIIDEDSMGFRYGKNLILSNNTFIDNGLPITITKLGSELKLVYEKSGSIVYYESSPGLPQRSTLLSFVNPTTCFDAPGNHMSNLSAGLCAKGQTLELIMINFDNQPTIYSIDKDSKTTIDSLPIYFLVNNQAGVEGSFTYANGYYWVGNGNTIEKIDPATGESIFQSIAIGENRFEAMAFDGTDLILASRDNQTRLTELFRYNINLNTVEKIAAISSPVSDIAIVSGKLYLASDNNIHKCTLAPFHVEKSYEIEQNLRVFGITNSDNQFWLATIRWNDTKPNYNIEQIPLD